MDVPSLMRQSVRFHRDRPALVAGDGPIGVFRKWARQFYEADAASAAS